MGYAYLASPYSHDDEEVRHLRFCAAERAVIYFVLLYKPIFSPIVHYHEIARRKDFPTDAEFWKPQNYAMLGACRELIVLDIPGLDGSVGVKDEWDQAHRMGKKISKVTAELVGVEDIVEKLLALA